MEKSSGIKYNINTKLKILPLLMYGLQWWVVAVPSIIVMGLVVAKLHFGVDIAAQTLYMQKLFGITGVSLIIQIFWGHRLPLVIGPASVLLIGVLSSISSGVSAIYTGILIGGVLVSCIAFSGMLNKLQSIFTPRVITVILLLVAITITPVIINLLFSDKDHQLFNLIFSLIFVISLLITNKLLKGIWKATTLVWGILIGTGICFLVTGIPSFNTTESLIHPEHTKLFIRFETNAGVILSFIFCSLALIVNELGSIQSVGHMLKADKMPIRTTKGVGITGLMNIAAGFFGVIGPIDFSTSPGIISATGCASRYPLLPAGIGLILCAFFPTVVSGLLYIPGVVMGTLLLYVMTSQMAASLQMLVSELAVKDYQSGVVIALPVMVTILISFAPAEVMNQLPTILRPIAGNGFVMGVITVFIMEHLIFRKK
jgi:Xanthine/uracil permeases